MPDPLSVQHRSGYIRPRGAGAHRSPEHVPVISEEDKVFSWSRGKYRVQSRKWSGGEAEERGLHTQGPELQTTIWEIYTWPQASLVTQMVKSLPAVRETQVRSPGQEDPPEKETATHSSILAWRIPQTRKPGGLQSMRSQRVRHDWVTNTHMLAPKGVLGLREPESLVPSEKRESQVKTQSFRPVPETQVTKGFHSLTHSLTEQMLCLCSRCCSSCLGYVCEHSRQNFCPQTICVLW